MDIATLIPPPLAPAPLRRPLEARNRAGPTPKEAEPRDLRMDGRPPTAPGIREVFEHFGARQTKDELVGKMFATQGPGAVNASELREFQSTLSAVDLPVLRLAQQEGITFGLVREGDNILEMGALVPRPLTLYTDSMAETRKFATEVNGKVASFDKQLAPLYEKREQLAGQSSQGANLDAQIDALKVQKEEAMAKMLRESSLPVSPLELVDDSGRTRSNSGSSKSPTGKPQSTADVARFVGATTPEEIKEYCSLVEQINPERIGAARQQALRDREQKLAHLPSDQQGPARLELAKLKNSPNDVVIDHVRYGLIFPDLHYRKDESGNSLRLDVGNARSLMDWAGPKGVRARRGQESTISGEHFSEKNRILIQEDQVKASSNGGTGHGVTAIHELGHALERIVQDKSPDFYSGWENRAQTSFDRQADHTITFYAGSSRKEYTAEGVAHYYSDPKLLKLKDPELYARTEELLDEARRLGNAK